MSTTILFVNIEDDGEADAPDLMAHDREDGASCPIATQDIDVNLKNRQRAITDANYGPENPQLPNPGFWARLADKWDVTSEEAKTSRCGNCAAFIKTRSMLDCIAQGLDENPKMAEPVIKAADLGYCEIWDFKCAAARTCDAWVFGGPITDDNSDQEND